MSKGSGSIRRNSNKGFASNPRAGYLEKETSLKYTVDRDKVRIYYDAPIDVGEGFDYNDLNNKKDSYFISYNTRGDDGRFYIADGTWVETKNNATMKQMMDRVFSLIRNDYKSNNNVKDALYEIGDTEYNSPLSMHITASLEKDNKVRIKITRFKV